jgi:hypothetical protein
METVFSRISARRGNPVLLCNTFYNGGVPTDPYAITKVEIYKNQVLPSNLVATFVFESPCDPNYPSPGFKDTEDLPPGECGTEGQIGAPIDGKFCLLWDVPCDAGAPDVYLDVWYFLPSNPCLKDEFQGSTCCFETTDGQICPDLDCDDFDDFILKCCNRFWVYPNDWLCVDESISIRYGFEPLDQRYHKDEVRPLEVGIMPLPLYDNDFNTNMPIIPALEGSITIQTGNGEALVEDAPMEMGLRQGSYRSNPFVLRYTIDTTQFLIGTYNYRVKVRLPDGSSRVSKDFVFTVS